MRTKTIFFWFVSLLLLAALAACTGGDQPRSPAAEEAPQAQEVQQAQPTESVPQGAALLQARCTACHGLSKVEGLEKTADEWQATVERMVKKGAELNSDEQALLVQYLAENY